MILDIVKNNTALGSLQEKQKDSGSALSLSLIHRVQNWKVLTGTTKSTC